MSIWMYWITIFLDRTCFIKVTSNPNTFEFSKIFLSNLKNKELDDVLLISESLSCTHFIPRF